MCLLQSCVAVGPAFAGGVQRVRHHSDANRTRVVLDLDREFGYAVRQVVSPERIVIELTGATIVSPATIRYEGSPVDRIRFNRLNGRVQIVLDLDGAHDYRAFTLPARGNKPHRLVVDILVDQARPSVATSPATMSRRAAPIEAPGAGEPYVIVIDPGHGGDDPGTRGCGIAWEKQVVLGISKAMAEELRVSTNFTVILTRNRDKSVSLDERVEIARKSRGDLFVSIHANSARSSRARGSEVYFLSPRGATDQAAAELANRENAAHMLGFDSVDGADNDIVSILMDLKGSAILSRSSQLAEIALGELDRVEDWDARFIKQARFAVLRTLAMPSILVEVGFLSNKEEARRLKRRDTQRAMGRALAHTVIEYCERYGEKGRPLVVLHRVHKVERGDTLWDLARFYDTSVSALSAANDLQNNRIRVGQELVLP